MRKEIDYFELCRLIAQNKAPNKIKIDSYEYVWDGLDYFRETSTDRIIEMNEDHYLGTLCKGQIIIVAGDILDETEREYLRHMIKPFKKDVICIKKEMSALYPDMECLTIVTSTKVGAHNVKMPPFEKRTMYKGMEIEKRYAPGELDL